jgi:ABC-type antimicrobial peptide transport system permease subunit
LYNKLVFVALSSVWQEIVLTTILIEAIVPLTLLVGGLVSLVIISLTVWSKINRKLKTSSSDLHKAIGKQASPRQILLSKIIATLVLLLAAGLLISDFTATNRFGTGIYFTAGALILPGLLLMFNNQLGKKAKNLEFNWRTLMSNNISRNKKRSMSIMVLFALGTFITISTGLNQKNLYKNAQERSSGTGGFQFYMETTLPILADLNDSEAQSNMGIDPPMKFLQMRKSEGDDASCLNLNRVSSPRILGVKSDLLEHHFTFVSQTADLDPEQPWASLKKKLPGNVVPAIMDQTVIQWGLGKSVGDTLIYRNELGGELYLKIIGGLANSIFQGNVLIDEAMFLEHFPSSSGTHVILAEDNEENTEERKAMLSRAFRNEGLEVEIAAERLAKFNQVENTYLSIFLLLGGLALILGTVGLGISLARNIMDRSNEFGVLGAIGLRKKQIFSLITFEHLILLSLGTLIGAVSAFIATLPSLLSGLGQNSFLTALFLIMAILINGFIWITMISRSFLSKNLIASIREE